MSTAIALRSKQITETDIEPLSAAEIVLLQGDLSVLTASQRIEYYNKVCESTGLNPLTKPFEYIVLNGKLTLYAKKDATDQLRAINGISIYRLDQETVEGVRVVTAYGRDRNGREDLDVGAVPVAGLRGDAMANAFKKAITQAKRRLTLSLAGLGWLDETEIAQIPDAQAVVVDEQGVIVQEAPRTLEAAIDAQLADERPTEPAAEAPATGIAPAPVPGKEDTTEALPEATEEAPMPDAEPVDEEAYTPVLPRLSSVEFKTWCRDKGIMSAIVTQHAAALFGDDVVMGKVKMTDEQRYELQTDLALWLDNQS